MRSKSSRITKEESSMRKFRRCKNDDTCILKNNRAWRGQLLRSSNETKSRFSVIRSQPVFNGNPAVESGYTIDNTKDAVLRSAISVPLMSLTGVLGVLTLYRTQPDAFTHDHLRVLMAIHSKVALSIENALRYQQAESSA